jgi:shikimate dehydrogenase
VAAGTLIKLAVFGKPVAHSLSPRIHSLFAAQCGLEIDYRAIEATPESFPGLVAKLAGNGGRGCNITVPLKHDAWKLADRCSESAARAQAANTLVFYGSKEPQAGAGKRDSFVWYADSTDGMGLVNDLQSIPGFRLRGARVCLIGAGGAAASVLGALLRSEPESVLVANRTKQRAVELAQAHSDLGIIDACSPDELRARASFDVLINATSLGHAGGTPELPFSCLKTGGLCYDMNYGRAAEPLRQMCLKNSFRYSDGLGMLVAQAALSFRLWSDQAPDAAEVLRELRGATG